MTTLLTICTRAIDELTSIETPAYLYGNSDDAARQLIALAKKVGTQLVRDYDWQQMAKTYTFVTTTAAQYALPTDYERIIPDTFWDVTQARQIRGASTARRWAAANSQVVALALDYEYRLAGNMINIYPAPVAGSTFTFEYLSNLYCTTSAGVGQSEWSGDTDLAALPEDLFIAGVKYYFMALNNISGAEDAKADWALIINSRKSKNAPVGKIDLGAAAVGSGPFYNIPDGVDATG